MYHELENRAGEWCIVVPTGLRWNHLYRKVFLVNLIGDSSKHSTTDSPSNCIRIAGILKRIPPGILPGIPPRILNRKFLQKYIFSFRFFIPNFCRFHSNWNPLGIQTEISSGFFFFQIFLHEFHQGLLQEEINSKFSPFMISSSKNSTRNSSRGLPDDKELFLKFIRGCL